MKGKPQTGRKSKHISEKGFYTEYIKNLLNPVIKLQIEQIFQQRICTDGK